MPRYQTGSAPCIRALGPCRLARRKHLSVNVCVARSASRSRDPPSRSFRLIDVWRGCRRREYQDRNSRTIKMRRHSVKTWALLTQVSIFGTRQRLELSWRRQVVTRPRPNCQHTPSLVVERAAGPFPGIDAALHMARRRKTCILSRLYGHGRSLAESAIEQQTLAG